MAPTNPIETTKRVEPVEVAGRLRVSVTRLARLMRQQEASGLTPTLRAALATVARHGPLTLGELAAHEQVTKPTTTSIVTKLEARGLVARRADATDRRVCWVEVTPLGRSQLELNRERRTEWLASRLRALPADQLTCLAAALDALDTISERPERDPDASP
ncbi:MAG TPA: MarR family transcriptional regulator [Acidimicrobiia bacterium]|nr:MarR family transcriptional regulator [Acidimicrobiia bacterium]